MKAIIMAGGIGSRLYPITKTKPKPLVPIMGTPVMAYTLALLSKHGIKECVVTTRYLGEMIKERFGEEFCGVKITYSEEKKPLGTAGGVKSALDKLHLENNDEDENVLIISGDALTDIDLSAAVAFHEKNAAEVTIVLKRTSDPIGLGVVVCDEKSGRIERFSEKPDWSCVISDTVNTGIYILKCNVLSYLKENTFYDFSKDVFPVFKEDKKRLFGFVADGYWSDVGTMRSYYQSNYDVLYGRVSSYLPDIYTKDVVTFRDGSRSFFSRGAVIDEDIFKNGGGRNIIVGKNTIISSGASVKDSVLGESVVIENDSKIIGSIICDGTVVGESALITSGCVLGSNTEIGNNVLLLRDSMTEPYSSVASKNIKPFNSPELVRRTESGVIIGLRGTMTHELCGLIGAALVNCIFENGGTEKNRISILFHGELYGIAHAISCGCVWRGADVSLLFPSDKALASFTSYKKNEKTVYLECLNDEVVMHIYDETSLECTFEIEEKFISELHRNIPVSDRNFGICERDAVTVRAYREKVDEILSHIKTIGENKISFTIKGGGISARMLEASLSDMGYSCKESNENSDIAIELTEDSDKCEATVFGMHFDFDAIRLVLTERLNPAAVKDGMFAISCDDVSAFVTLTEKAGFLPMVYSRSSKASDDLARRSAKENLWMRDGAMCAASFVSLLARRNFDKNWICDVKKHIPEIMTACKEIPDVDRAHTMTKLYNAVRERELTDTLGGRVGVLASDSDDGMYEGLDIIFASDNDSSERYSGRVKIRAMRENGIRIFAEAYNAEVAEELCKAIENKIL